MPSPDADKVVSVGIDFCPSNSTWLLTMSPVNSNTVELASLAADPDTFPVTLPVSSPLKLPNTRDA